jgi:hypothetical protein
MLRLQYKQNKHPVPKPTAIKAFRDSENVIPKFLTSALD